MMTFKLIRSITILVVFGILIHWSCFSDCSHAAQVQKAPVATLQKIPAPVKQVKTSLIEGRAVCGTRGMGGIEIILKEYFKNGRVGIAGKQTTNHQGYYKFSIAVNDNIAQYRIAAKHPDLALGDYFSPREREFLPAMGLTKTDFVYSGPLPDLVPVHISDSAALIRNQGGLAAGPFQVTFTYKCNDSSQERCYPKDFTNPVFSISLNRLDPGQQRHIGAPPPICHCVPVSVGWQPNPTPEHDEPASVSAVSVDIKDVVVESNENNNTMQ